MFKSTLAIFALMASSIAAPAPEFIVERHIVEVYKRQADISQLLELASLAGVTALPHRPRRPPPTRTPRQLSRLCPPHVLCPQRPPHRRSLRLRFLYRQRPLLCQLLRKRFLSRQQSRMVQLITHKRPQLSAYIFRVWRIGGCWGRDQECDS
ncbi:hypothetical protein HO173_004996 [Letharia columbiana]|uniref:Uncharacterized protein n=1 Tax=Letharia columbiana TaxID=112416 RepID=A0A8H6FXK2_9LECA|nr:uncharacterized protein HO173_004996 [Letharia columbiana]KAF6236705.1 hypothetical protein HO173_004996 [Letharia columbiana]